MNSNMEYIVKLMVCGHEIGHDCLHREQAKGASGLQEFTLFDMRNEMEYEANAFSAHLRIDDDELMELMKQGYDVVQLSSIMETNVNLMLIKLNELNRMGWQLTYRMYRVQISSKMSSRKVDSRGFKGFPV